MNIFKKNICRFGLPLVLAVSAFSGTIAEADGQMPTPPAATSVALNTYGSLPVVMLNLTQSPMNLNILTSTPGSYTKLPAAIGLPGVYYYESSGMTTTLSNILTPTINPGGISDTSHSSLLPAATINPTTNVTTYNGNFGWMSMFTLFPSWTQPATYNNVQYVALSDVNNLGAAAYQYNVVSGYPDGNGKNATTNGHFTSALALNAGQPTVTTLKMFMLNTTGVVQTAYNIKINSLGGGTPGSVSVPSTGFSILGALHSVLNVVTDIATCASGDPLGIIDFIAGLPATIDGIVTDVSNNSNGVNVNITTNTAYPATSKGINVTASADPVNTPNGQILTAVSGDSQSLMYEVQSTTTSQLPLIQQNAVFVTTWRQSPADNYGVTLPNGADTLFVVVLNEGLYAASNIQQSVNNNSTAQMAGGAKYKPTAAQAQDSAKIHGILTAISQKNPQDAKTIIGMFGIHGTYDKIKNDPNALKNLKADLKTIFTKYQKDLPAIEQYLAKIAQS